MPQTKQTLHQVQLARRSLCTPNRLRQVNTLMQETAGPVIVTARDLAKLYRVSPECIGRWAKMGKIPVIRFEGTVRYNLAAVRRAVEGESYQPPTEAVAGGAR